MATLFSTISAHLPGSPRAKHAHLALKRSRALRADSAAELRAQSARLRAQVQVPRLIDEPPLMIAAAALFNETVRRVHGFELHPEQIQAGFLAARGTMVQLPTGEGKTLAAALAAYLQSIGRLGVHVATTNAYLATRDCELARQLLTRLDVTVGLLQEGHSDVSAREAYCCDVTYGPGHAFGFDYLRDARDRATLASDLPGRRTLSALEDTPGFTPRQRALGTVIVDEADCQLMDEATLPLLLAGEHEAESEEPYLAAQEVAAGLQMGVDFDTTEGDLRLLKTGGAQVDSSLCAQVATQLTRPWRGCVRNALVAQHQLLRDRDYVVREGRIVIVDQNTGRLCEERAWQDGLHRAVEVKEGLTVRGDARAQVSVMRQRFFSQYQRLGGLTATIVEGRREMRSFYNTPIAVLPAHRPCRREVWPARFFVDQNAKFAAMAHSALALHRQGRPVLMGTATIDQSEVLSRKLKAGRVPHQVLNGVQDAQEAELIARAGSVGNVLVATNMAGRGTDIRLTERARALGGLHVMAAQHALSTRIDRQLLGRCARHGDPGSCQVFAAASDDLFANHAPHLAARIVVSADRRGESPRGFSASVRRLQRHMEAQQFAGRRRVLRAERAKDRMREALF